MKVILVGYPSSQPLLPITKYLAVKYLPAYFNITFLNYTGEINGWSNYVADHLETLIDKEIVFALDDYFIADSLNMREYCVALEKIGGDIVSVKLCYSTPQEHEEYPVTTQYTIWNRKYLISLLRKVNTPWQFEIDGSKLFDKQTIHIPCLNYFTNSSISSRWEGVRLDGLKKEDIDYIKQNHLIA